MIDWQAFESEYKYWLKRDTICGCCGERAKIVGTLDDTPLCGPCWNAESSYDNTPLSAGKDL